jgi:energy-coupling factor transporter ATP-binding protein EcfA2
MNKAAVELFDFTYSYPDGDKPALSGIHLNIPEGELLGVIGPSGSGKSSLCYALSGFIPHFFQGNLSGGLRVLGMEIPQVELGDIAGSVGLVVQNPFNQISGARYTVREEIAFGLENLGLDRKAIIDRVDETLDQFRLSDMSGRSPYTLSGGQQQRLALASIFAMQPSILILDEPTSQLDPAGTQEIFEVVHNLTQLESTTVILVTHKLEWLAEFASRVVVLMEGEIKLEGETQQVLTDARLEEWGIGSTQYTRAARLAARQQLIPEETLPLTLREAHVYFSQT